jgi:hypothetical protein
MVAEHGRKRLPPYISYRTFHNFLEGLQQRMPARIDRSYWGDILSGSTGTQLMAALRFLDLVDETGRPTDRLKPLVTSRGEQRNNILREIALTSFDFVLEGELDPQNATYSQLEEIFSEKYQLTGQLSRKCLKFFIELSNNAGITLSPFITKRFRSGYSATNSKLITKKTAGGTKVITKSTNVRMGRNVTIQNNTEDTGTISSWDKMLLTKFPTFDPNWSDDVKLKWFTAFDELMRRILNNKQDK